MYIICIAGRMLNKLNELKAMQEEDSALILSSIVQISPLVDMIFLKSHSIRDSVLNVSMNIYYGHNANVVVKRKVPAHTTFA